MIDFYEVTLLLEDDKASVYNPVFVFEEENEAIKLVKIFINHGYSVSVKITYVNDGRK